MNMTDIGEIEIKRELTVAASSSVKVRNLDERRLNALLDTIPNVELETLIYKPLNPHVLEKQKRRSIVGLQKLPTRLSSIITTLGLLDELDYRKRLYIFTGYCRYMNYSINTASKYLNLMKRHGIFGKDNDHLTIDRSSFVDSGRIHTRTFSFEGFKKLLLYLHQNFSKFTAPILLACYSGLRTFEILQFSNITLHQLSLKQTTVSIFRKKTFRQASTKKTTMMTTTTINDATGSDDVNAGGIDDDDDDDGAADRGASSNEWQPVYTTHLNAFVVNLARLYRDEFVAYQKNGIIIKLFNITPKTLCSRLRAIFFLVNGYKLPLGAGIHSLRNMLAMLMAQQTENIWAIQHMLQHKDSRTTRRYIHADFTHISKEFNRLTDTDLSDVKKSLMTAPS